MRKLLKEIVVLIAVAAMAFMLSVLNFVHNAILGRQSRTPDADLGYVVPHELKGAVFYVTPLEDQLLNASDAVFWIWGATVFIGVLVSYLIKIMKMRPSSK